MKKTLLYSAVSILLLASCASNSDDTDSKESKLTSVVIGAKSITTKVSSRAVWSDPEDNGEETTITVKFEKGEQFDLYEVGCDDAHVFTAYDTYQSGNFYGTWHGDDATRWAAVLPHGAAASMTMSGTTNTYNVTLPDNQTTKLDTKTTGLVETTLNYLISPDVNANIMIGAENNHTVTTCFFAPVCAYLYFATSTDITKVVISCSDIKTKDKYKTEHTGYMAGSVAIETEGEWDGWDDFVSCLTNITPDASNEKSSITVTGQPTDRSNTGTANINEYMACIYPGIYTNLKFKLYNGDTLVKTLTNTSTLTLSSVNMYYFNNLSDIKSSSAKGNFLTSSKPLY